MNTVVITDSRKGWMIREDAQMACMTRCHLYKNCQTRVGRACKKMGGKTIPKINIPNNGKGVS